MNQNLCIAVRVYPVILNALFAIVRLSAFMALYSPVSVISEKADPDEIWNRDNYKRATSVQVFPSFPFRVSGL